MGDAITELISENHPQAQALFVRLQPVAFWQHSFGFLTCVSYTAHVIDIGWTYICPSVCPSHAGIVSKRLNLSSNCLHCLVAP